MTTKDTAGIMRAFLSREMGTGSRVKLTPNHPRYANTSRAATIQQIRSAALKDMDTIRKNDGLTEKGKAQALAARWQATNDEINRLAKADRDDQIRRYNSIERQLFGATKVTGADADAARNATAAADNLSNPNAAITALDDATRNGDDTLARAIAYKAWQSGWGNVIDVYAERTPGLGDRLSELSDLHEHLNRTSVFSNEITKPAELSRIPLSELNQYVSTPPQQTINNLLTNRFTNGITPQQERELREAAAAEARGDAE